MKYQSSKQKQINFCLGTWHEVSSMLVCNSIHTYRVFFCNTFKGITTRLDERIGKTTTVLDIFSILVRYKKQLPSFTRAFARNSISNSTSYPVNIFSAFLSDKQLGNEVDVKHTLLPCGIQHNVADWFVVQIECMCIFCTLRKLL